MTAGAVFALMVEMAAETGLAAVRALAAYLVVHSLVLVVLVALTLALYPLVAGAGHVPVAVFVRAALRETGAGTVLS